MSIHKAVATFGIPRLTLGATLREKGASTVTIRGKTPMLSKAIKDR